MFKKFANWLLTKEPDTTYNYIDNENCGLAQFLKETGVAEVPNVTGFHWRDGRGPEQAIDTRINNALALSKTFGEALNRLILKADNLNKLADYLDTLPDDYEAFQMVTFFSDPDLNPHPKMLDYALHNGGVDKCGAVACAVGHGPSAGLLVPPELVIDKGYVNWSGYTDLMFIEGLNVAARPSSFAFSWMFDADWAGHDNTPKGAAKRIRWLLKNGIHAIPTHTPDWAFSTRVIYNREVYD